VERSSSSCSPVTVERPRGSHRAGALAQATVALRPNTDRQTPFPLPAPPTRAGLAARCLARHPPVDVSLPAGPPKPTRLLADTPHAPAASQFVVTSWCTFLRNLRHEQQGITRVAGAASGAAAPSRAATIRVATGCPPGHAVGASGGRPSTASGGHHLRLVPRTDHSEVPGPVPKWCSATCRHRAWEQTRAARSGRSAVEVVARVVVTPSPPALPRAPRHGEWVDALRALAGRSTADSSTTGSCSRSPARSTRSSPHFDIGLGSGDLALPALG